MRIKSALLLHLAPLMLSATASCWAADDVFKWVDSSGHVYYGDDPPEGIHATRVEGGVSVVSDMGGRIKPSASPGASSSTTNPASVVQARGSDTQADTQTALRERMIQHCEDQRGVNCADEVDGLLGNTLPPPDYGYSLPVFVRTVRPPIRRPQLMRPVARLPAVTRESHQRTRGHTPFDQP